LEKPPRFRHVFFVLAVSAVLMNSIDSTIVAVAVPQLTSALASPRSIAVIVTSILASLWLIRLGYRIPMLVGSGLVMIMLLLLGTGWTSVQVGGLSVTAISLALTFFPNRGQGLAVIFGALSISMLVVVPLTLSIPDSARERHLQHLAIDARAPTT
jgi:hypothetical protein